MTPNCLLIMITAFFCLARSSCNSSEAGRIGTGASTGHARDWNVKDSGSGYVVRFQIRAEHIDRYEEQTAGGRQYTEYWIPAEHLDEFNDNIVGSIEMIAEYHGDS
jgi:hypothetical protein